MQNNKGQEMARILEEYMKTGATDGAQQYPCTPYHAQATSSRYHPQTNTARTLQEQPKQSAKDRKLARIQARRTEEGRQKWKASLPKPSYATHDAMGWAPHRQQLWQEVASNPNVGVNPIPISSVMQPPKFELSALEKKKYKPGKGQGRQYRIARGKLAQQIKETDNPEEKLLGKLKLLRSSRRRMRKESERQSA